MYITTFLFFKESISLVLKFEISEAFCFILQPVMWEMREDLLQTFRITKKVIFVIFLLLKSYHNPKNIYFPTWTTIKSWNSLPVHIKWWMHDNCKMNNTKEEETSTAKKSWKWIQRRNKIQKNNAIRESGMFQGCMWVKFYSIIICNFLCLVT